MSTLDQAFIRAYNKDRRSAAAPGAASAESANNGNVAQNNAAHNTAMPHAAMPSAATANQFVNQTGTTPTQAPHEEASVSESGRWFRVDAAGNLHTRHQRMGEPVGTETANAPPAAQHSSPRATKATVDYPVTAQSPPDNAAVVQHVRHAGHRLPPYPHLHNTATAEAPEMATVSAANTGRKTLASYLAQNQAPLVSEPPEPATSPMMMVDAKTQPIFNGPVKSTVPPSNTTNNSAVSSATASNVRIDSQSTPAPSSFRAVATVTTTAASSNETAGVMEDTKPARTITQEASRSTLKMPAVGHFKTTRTDRPVVHETETAKTKFAALPFPAVWEVDSLVWPDVQNTLIADQEKAFAKIAAHLSDACRQGLQVLVVTSPTEGEGRSTIASCIARSVAQRGIQVVLIDGDLENPSLADTLNLEISQGWNDAIAEGMPLEEIAVHSLEDKLTLLPLTYGADAPKTAHIERYIGAVLDRLRESFDLIVVDATYMNSLDNRLIGSDSDETVDAMILVTDGRIDDPQQIETAVRRIKNLGISSVGIVENFTGS
jgi:Mrp family chromosome partitioning ATPase